jgi:hypothetical protein
MFEILAFDPEIDGKWYVYEGLEFETQDQAEAYLAKQFGEDSLEDDDWRIREVR